MKTQDHIRPAAPLLALCFAFTLAGRSPAAAGPLIYSTADKGALLVTTDFATGETKVIGPTGQILATGLACSGTGTLYTFTHAFDKTGESQLAKLDLTTGEARPYGEKNSLQLMGLTFTSDGTLLGAGWTDGALYSINLETGVPTKIGDLGDAKDVMDLTIHPNGNMYGIDETGSIFQIDPKTAKATLATKISGLARPMGLGFDADGTGYVVGIVPQAPVYRIDLTTGQITGTLNTTLNFLHSAEIMITPPPRSAGPLIYSTADHGALLVTIDFATGETKVIGPTGQIQAEGLAFDGTGTLYTFTHAFDTTGESQLAKFDLTTGEAKPYGEKNSLQFMGLGFTPDGTLYGSATTDGALYTINLETGVPTKIGDLGDAGRVMDLTIHPNGKMYGIRGTGAIFEIDPKTAKATLAVKFSEFTFPMGLTFDADGTGYVTEIIPQAHVYRIDLTTGQIISTLNTTLNDLHSAEIMVTPRPHLAVRRERDRLVLSWPSAMNSSLQASDRVGNGSSWADVTTPAMPVGDQTTVTEGLLGLHRFFRLIQR